MLENLYDEMKNTPVQVNLNEVWAGLEVRIGKQGVTFDDGARYAAIRRAIASPPESASQEHLTGGIATILAGRTVRDPRGRQA